MDNNNTVRKRRDEGVILLDPDHDFVDNNEDNSESSKNKMIVFDDPRNPGLSMGYLPASPELKLVVKISEISKESYFNDCFHVIMDYSTSNIPHPNVMDYRGIFVGIRTLGLVMPYMETTLQNEITTDRFVNMPIKDKLSIIYDVAKGLRHLHYNDVFHNDLSQDNIFLHEGRAIIGDFDASPNWNYRWSPKKSDILFPDHKHLLPKQRNQLKDVELFGLFVLHLITDTPDSSTPEKNREPLLEYMRTPDYSTQGIPDVLTSIIRDIVTEGLPKLTMNQIVNLLDNISIIPVEKKKEELILTGRMDIHNDCLRGDLQSVKNKIDQLENQDKFGYRPIHFASVAGNIELVQFMIGKGVRIDSHDNIHKATPLVVSLQRGNYDLSKYLISINADINFPSETIKLAPIHIALLGQLDNVLCLYRTNRLDLTATLRLPKLARKVIKDIAGIENPSVLAIANEILKKDFGMEDGQSKMFLNSIVTLYSLFNGRQ